MSNILIGITGGIAAYKTCYLIREFKKNGHNVKVIMTENALKFIGKATIETLSENIVYTSLWNNKIDTKHIELSEWADIFITAPATANIIGKYANGIGDDIVSTIFMSFDRIKLIVPAMNNRMFENSIVQENIKKLKKHKVYFIEPETGFLACGANARGRFPEYMKIFNKSVALLYKDAKLKNKKILITGGALYEKIDPVRIISNMSSGKTAIAFANAAYKLKSDNILLIHGQMKEKPPVFTHNIYTPNAKTMLNEIKKYIKNYDILIMAAAVSDFKPEYSKEKIKKTNEFSLHLEKNIDILKSIRNIKILKIGFALESNNKIKNGLKKLKEKNLDYIIINSPNNIDSEKASIEMISKNGKKLSIKDKNKEEMAIEVLKWIE